MSEGFLATSKVKIEPSVVGFQGSLRKQVRDAIVKVGPQKVEIAPTLAKGFGKSLRTQVKAAIKTSGVYHVEVRPRVTALRQLVKKELDKNPVEVPIKPKGGGRGTDGTEGETDANNELTESEKRAADAEKERKVIVDQLTKSENLLKAAMREGISATERDILLTQSQTEARRALLKVTERQVAEEGLFRSLQSQRAVGVLEKGQGFESGIAAAAEKEAAHSAAIAEAAERETKQREDLANENKRAEKESKALVSTNESLADSERKVAAAIQSGVPARQLDVALSKELGAVRKIERTTAERFKSVSQGTNQALADELRLTSEKAKKVGNGIQQTQAQIKAARDLGIVTEKQNSVIRGLSAANATDVKTLTNLSAVKAENTKLTAVENELRGLSAIATKTDDTALKEFVTTKRAEVAVRKQALADQKKAIAQTAVETTQQQFAQRGFLATLASLIGVRGATLAANNAFLLGAASAAIFAKAVGSAAKLETELNVFRVTAGATADEMEKVQATAKTLGADITLPGVAAGDAAGAMTDLAKAGLDVTDSMEGARGSLQLATAAQISNSEATELVASALNAFSLNGTQATHVADLLTGAANEAQGSISDMGIALQQSSAVARQAGLSLEDTVAFITLLAKNGIRGSDAGTSLRTSLLRLIAPTDEATKQLKELGITVLDMDGNIRPEVFSELATALSKLDATSRNQTLRKIFGQDAIRAAVIFGREGTEGLNKVREATNQFGLAAELAGARTAGFQGKIEGLKNSLETLGVTFGQVVIPALTNYINNLNIATGIASKATGSTGGGFLNKLAGTLLAAGTDPTVAIKEVAKQVRDLVHLADAGADFNLRLPSRQLKSFRNELKKAAGEAKRLDEILSEALEARADPDIQMQLLLGDSIGDVEAMVLALRKMKAEINGTDVASANARVQLEAIERLVVALGRKPTLVELEFFLDKGFLPDTINDVQSFFDKNPGKIPLVFDQESVVFLKRRGVQAASETAHAMMTMFGNILSPEAFELMFGFALGGVKTAIEKFEPEVGPVRGLDAKSLQARIAGFDAAKVRAELRGTTEDVVAVLREEQAFLEQQLRTPKAQKQPFIKRLIESALLGIDSELAGIAEDKKSKSKDAAEAIKDSLEDADEAAIAAFGRKEEDAEARILIAESTEQLDDDIDANRRLRGILRAQLKNADERIKSLTERRDFKRATARKILQLTLEIKADEKAAAKATAEALATAKQERQDAIRESIQLNIEFFNIKGNEKAEIRARQALIRNLQKEIDAIKRQKNLTLAKRNRLKELRNEQERERQAIKDLKKEKEESNDAMRALMFTFLQTQQGFAANLLGNLIPAGISGLNNVNGPSGSGGGGFVSTGPGAGGAGAAGFGGGLAGALIKEKGISDAGRDKGASSGQLSELIEINRGILRMLGRIAGDTKHPEAKRSRISNRTAFDLHGPGV